MVDGNHGQLRWHSLCYCHEERNHAGVGGQIIVLPASRNRPGPITCRKRLGAILRFHRRKAV